MIWLFDLCNALICLLIIIIAFRVKLIPNWIALVLSAYSFLPFFLNDFLFPATYMKDQFAYFNMVKEVRSLNFFPGEGILIDNAKTYINDQYVINNKILITSWILALIPLPYVESIQSLGFFNKLLFLILFLWLYSKKFLRGGVLLFAIFYPSLVFYTSLSLRDPLIMFLTTVSMIFLIEKKYFKFFFILFPLYFIKFQNFYFLISFLFFLKILKIKIINNFLKLIIATSFIIIIMSYLDLINYYRFSMFIENGGNFSEYISVNRIGDLSQALLSSIPSLLLRPFPWEIENNFQLIQSIENILVLCFLIVFTIKSYIQNSYQTSVWLFFLIFTISISSLVTFNFGTGARYKYNYIFIYVIGLTYNLYRDKYYNLKTQFKAKKFL